MRVITRATALTDIGRARKRNEDSVRVDGALGVAIVADGMGGHPAGDQASRLAAEQAYERLRDVQEALSTGGISADQLGARMEETVRDADERVRRAGQEDPTLERMGTTLTAMLVEPRSGRYVIGHVGDSRAYRFRSGRLELLTRDHTWVWEQVLAGRITQEQAWGHPHGNVITQALGVDTPAEPDVLDSQATPGDVFLLCSDGLSGMLRDAQIAALLSENLPKGLEVAAEALVAAANREGGRDNITVALLAVEAGG